jgi:hypothetical protein
MSVLVSDLILQVRQYADMVNSSFVTDSEILGMLNQAHQDAYLAVIKANEGYFVEDSSLAVTGETVSLPVTAFKIVGVDHEINGRTVTMRRFNFQERNQVKSLPGSWRMAGFSKYRYCITGNKIRFMPIPDCAFTATLYYIPFTPNLTLAGTLDYPVAQWDCYLINTAAAVCVAKEERDNTFWILESQKAMQQIVETVQNRDESEPMTCVDVYALNTVGNSDW